MHEPEYENVCRNRTNSKKNNESDIDAKKKKNYSIRSSIKAPAINMFEGSQKSLGNCKNLIEVNSQYNEDSDWDDFGGDDSIQVNKSVVKSGTPSKKSDKDFSGTIRKKLKIRKPYGTHQKQKKDRDGSVDRDCKSVNFKSCEEVPEFEEKSTSNNFKKSETVTDRVADKKKSDKKGISKNDGDKKSNKNIKKPKKANICILELERQCHSDNQLVMDKKTNEYNVYINGNDINIQKYYPPAIDNDLQVLRDPTSQTHTPSKHVNISNITNIKLFSPKKNEFSFPIRRNSDGDCNFPIKSILKKQTAGASDQKQICLSAIDCQKFSIKNQRKQSEEINGLDGKHQKIDINDIKNIDFRKDCEKISNPCIKVGLKKEGWKVKDDPIVIDVKSEKNASLVISDDQQSNMHIRQVSNMTDCSLKFNEINTKFGLNESKRIIEEDTQYNFESSISKKSSINNKSHILEIPECSYSPTKSLKKNKQKSPDKDANDSKTQNSRITRNLDMEICKSKHQFPNNGTNNSFDFNEMPGRNFNVEFGCSLADGDDIDFLHQSNNQVKQTTSSNRKCTSTSKSQLAESPQKISERSVNSQDGSHRKKNLDDSKNSDMPNFDQNDGEGIDNSDKDKRKESKIQTKSPVQNKKDSKLCCYCDGKVELKHYGRLKSCHHMFHVDCFKSFFKYMVCCKCYKPFNDDDVKIVSNTKGPDGKSKIEMVKGSEAIMKYGIVYQMS